VQALMPPPLPDRFSLEVRLGRDGDIELWLARDTSLDRPVEIRFLGPDTGHDRRRRFLSSVRDAAAVSHPHFTSVYTAGEVPDGVYAVSEWTGAISFADRLASNETIPVEEFLPNASGLAEALTALHAEGIVHGAIDTGALFHAVAHPAKLGGVGRIPRTSTAIDDVRSLAAALEEGLTGQPPGGPPPSEVVDALSPAVDRILHDAQAGLLTARAFANELSAAPTPKPPPPESPRFSRRLLMVATILVAAAVSLIMVGRLLVADTGSPILVPDSPQPAATPVTTVATTLVDRPAGSADGSDDALEPVDVLEVAAFDPFGEQEENDDRIPALVDGDPDTSWRTERYRDPLPALKPGVGLVFAVGDEARRASFGGITRGVHYELRWSESMNDDIDEWERIAGGETISTELDVQLPNRDAGRWLLWLTDLPEASDGGHLAEIAEVRFRR
jgi:hypothetical protein